MNTLLDVFVNAIAVMSMKTKELTRRAGDAITKQEMDEVEADIKRHYKRYGRISNWGGARWGSARISPVCVYHHEMRFKAYQ